MKGPFEKPPKEPRNTRAHLTKEVIVPSSVVNICFTNSQEFNSLVANSDELSITSKGNNESSAVHNISKDSSNEQSNEAIINNNSSANSIERSKKLLII